MINIKAGILPWINMCHFMTLHTDMQIQLKYQVNIPVVQVVSLSLCFNSHFPGGPELASTRTSPFWILLELRMMEVVVTNVAIRRAKLQSNRHHQQINTSLQVRCPSCRPASRQRTEGSNDDSQTSNNKPFHHLRPSINFIYH